MTPIEQIQAWIEDKPIWWKHSIKLALEHGELDQSDLDEVYYIARVEHQLVPSEECSTSNSQDLDFTGHTSEQGKVNLLSLSEVYGVGALGVFQPSQYYPASCNNVLAVRIKIVPRRQCKL